MTPTFEIGLLPPQKKELAVRLYGKMITSLGKEIYYIGGGKFTGKGGWKSFNDALKEQGFRIQQEILN